MTAHTLPMRTAMPLERAESALLSLWGRPADVRRPARALTPDWVAVNARAAGFEVQVERIADWEDRSDADLMAELTSRLGRVTGRLVVVTEASYGSAGTAFELDAAELREFLREHAQRYEPVFNGDLVVAALELGSVACLHHEGYLFLVLPPRPRS